MDSLVVVADMVAHLQQQSNGVLTHTGGSIGRDVAHQDSLLLGVVVVGHIVAGSQEGNQLQVGALVHGLLGDGGLVGDDHLCVTDPLRDDGVLHIGGPVIDRQFPHRTQLIPAQVARIFCITIQHYDFHCSSLLILYGVLCSNFAFCPWAAVSLKISLQPRVFCLYYMITESVLYKI